MRDEGTLRDGVRAGLPLVLPTLAIGASFGVLAAPVLGAVPSVVMSVVVFAGGAQLAALSVIASGGNAVAAIVAGLLMNARFLPMSFALGPTTRGRPLARAAQGQAIVDASFVIANRGDGTFDPVRLIGATLPQAAAWISGTVIGVVAGDRIGDPDAFGLDAVFPAFFLAILVGELRRGRARVAAALAAVITLLLVPVAPPGVAVVAASVAALVGLWPGRREPVHPDEPAEDPA